MAFDEGAQTLNRVSVKRGVAAIENFNHQRYCIQSTCDALIVGVISNQCFEGANNSDLQHTVTIL